jgi:hypothetical protein
VPLRILSLARRAAVFLIAVSSVACSDPTAPEASGRYALHSVDGRTLPAVMYQEGGRTREATGGYLEFEADSTFWVLFLLRDVQAGIETHHEDGVGGTWWQTGDRVFMTFPDGLVLGATIDHRTVTLDRVPAGFVYVYRR